jgi:hypothetical protein
MRIFGRYSNKKENSNVPNLRKNNTTTNAREKVAGAQLQPRTIVFVNGRPTRIVAIVKGSTVVFKLVRKYLELFVCLFEREKTIVKKLYDTVHQNFCRQPSKQASDRTCSTQNRTGALVGKYQEHKNQQTANLPVHTLCDLLSSGVLSTGNVLEYPDRSNYLPPVSTASPPSS